MKAPKKSKLDKFRFRQTSYDGKAVALYIRVSSDEFVKNEAGERELRTSIKTQIDDAITKAKSMGWTKYVIYDEDCNISGAEDGLTRPAISRLIKDIESGLIHSVIFRDLSRFARNEYLWKWFEFGIFIKYGVKPISLTEDINIETSEGRMLTGIKANQAQAYIMEQSEKAQRSKLDRAKDGILRTSPCYGYGIQEVDGIRKCICKDNEKAVVEEVFKRIANGEGTLSILRDLNRRKVLTRSQKPMAKRSLLDMVRTEKYKGVTVYSGKRYKKSPYPVIVSEKLWQDANDELDKRGTKQRGYRVRGHASNSHLLTGLLKCGYCFDKIHSEEQSTLRRYENYAVYVGLKGKLTSRYKYLLYRCQTKAKQHFSVCPDSRAIDLVAIETFIRDTIGNIVASNIAIKDTGRESELKAVLEDKKSRLARLEAKAKSLLDELAGGDLSGKDYAVAKLRNKELTDAVESEVARLTDEITVQKGKEINQVLPTLAKWDSLSFEVRKTALRQVIDRILVYKDHIRIYLAVDPAMFIPHNFKRGGKIDKLMAWCGELPKWDNIYAHAMEKLSKSQ